MNQQSAISNFTDAFMVTGIIGRKVGMTQVFDPEAPCIPPP